MIDPSFDTVEVTKEADLMLKVLDLEAKLKDMTYSMEYHRMDATRYSNYINSFENALKENSWDFDAETLKDLASHFDISLEREYMVDITVRFSGTVTVPVDYDIDSLENDITASIITDPYTYCKELDVDFGCEGMEIFTKEV